VYFRSSSARWLNACRSILGNDPLCARVGSISLASSGAGDNLHLPVLFTVGLTGPLTLSPAIRKKSCMRRWQVSGPVMSVGYMVPDATNDLKPWYYRDTD
jgi:hypothetical protein